MRWLGLVLFLAFGACMTEISTTTTTGTFTSSGAQDGYLLVDVINNNTANTITVSPDEFLSIGSTGYAQFTSWSGDQDELGTFFDPPRYTEATLTLVIGDSTDGLTEGGVLTAYYPPKATLTNIYDAGLSLYRDSSYACGSATVAARASPGDVLTITVDMVKLVPYTGNGGWDGKITFNLGWVSADPSPTSSDVIKLASSENATYAGPSLSATWHDFLTGMSGPVDAQSRVDRCGKCGHIDIREKFVRDAWSEGLWVCRDCWDPEDPKTHAIPPDKPPINDS